MDMEDMFGDLLADSKPITETKEVANDPAPQISEHENVAENAERSSPHEGMALGKETPLTYEKKAPAGTKALTPSTSSLDSSPASTATKKRRRGLSSQEAKDTARRRLTAFEAALSSPGGEWNTNVELVSVQGYHQQEREMEL